MTWASLVAHMVKNLPAIQETWVQYWVGKIPWRREWQPTQEFLTGESHGLIFFPFWELSFFHLGFFCCANAFKVNSVCFLSFDLFFIILGTFGGIDVTACSPILSSKLHSICPPILPPYLGPAPEPSAKRPGS